MKIAEIIKISNYLGKALIFAEGTGLNKSSRPYSFLISANRWPSPCINTTANSTTLFKLCFLGVAAARPGDQIVRFRAWKNDKLSQYSTQFTAS